MSQGLLPGMDLSGDFKPAGQLCNGVLSWRAQSHFGLEDWAVLLTRLHVLLLVSSYFRRDSLIATWNFGVQSTPPNRVLEACIKDRRHVSS